MPRPLSCSRFSIVASENLLCPDARKACRIWRGAAPALVGLFIYVAHTLSIQRSFLLDMVI